MSDIKRLVYAPKAYAFIYSRTTGAVIDVSNDIVGGSIERVTNRPSTATLTLRNDDWQYTGRFNPKFLPMDGITIWLQKYKNNPIQEFTGFIDKVPYFQAYPGKIEIRASCTLKRLLHSYYDPGVGFVYWMQSKGWVGQGDGQNYSSFYNPMSIGDTLSQTGDKGNDGGMGQMLHDFLYEIAGLDPSEIIVGDLPNDLPTSMIKAYLNRVKESRAAENSLIPAMKDFITTSVNMTADQSTSALSSKFPTGLAATTQLNDIKKIIDALSKYSKSPKPTEAQIILAALVMSGIDKSYNGTDKRYPSSGRGLFANPGNALDGLKKKSDESIESQVVTFCENFNRIVRVSTTRPAPGAPDLNTTMAQQVAQTLAYGYGKERFYSQILDACNNANNTSTVQKILNNIRTNQSLDNVKSIDILTASEVAENVNPLNVTWDKLFSAPAVVSATDAIKIKSDGKREGSNEPEKLSADSFYSSPAIVHKSSAPAISAQYIPLIGGLPIKYDEVEYYMFATPIDNANYKFANGSALKAGSIVTIVNPANTSKSCNVLYLGVGNIYSTQGKPLNDKAPITISPKSLEAVGISGAKESDIKNIIFNVTQEFIPEAETEDKTASKARSDYLKIIKSLVGPVPVSKNVYTTSNISQSDRNVYKKFYESANNRLAEYFYIASNYNLHLVDNVKPQRNQLLLTEGPGSNGKKLVQFLIDTGMISPTSSIGLDSSGNVGSTIINVGTSAQSIPQEIKFSFNSGISVWTIKYPNGVPKASEEFDVDTTAAPAVFKNNPIAISIVATTDNNPKPEWNGETVRLPASTVKDSTNENNSGSITPTWGDIAMIATASAFTTITQFPTDLFGSRFLVGDKSLMNDRPVMDAVMQLSKGSMREFMSLPNGMFCAFYPDRFGVFGRKPYLQIDDVEIIDFNIDLDDGPLVTHMYVNGATIDPLGSGVTQEDMILSTGVVTMDDVFRQNKSGFVYDAQSISGVSSEIKNIDIKNEISDALASDYGSDYTQYFQGASDKSIRFFEIYGPRPKIDNDPLIRSPWFEFVSAYNQFTYNWSMHTATSVELTFMPELMAGGLVEFKQHDVVMYVEGVVHRWDYTSGFETTAYLSSPSTKRKSDGMVPGMVIFNNLG